MPMPHLPRPSSSPSMRALALFPALGGIAVVVMGSGPGLPAPRVSERFTIPGDAIALYDLAGVVAVESGTGTEASVEVMRRGADGAWKVSRETNLTPGL